jgi:hypothetical protein
MAVCEKCGREIRDGEWFHSELMIKHDFYKDNFGEIIGFKNDLCKECSDGQELNSIE